MHNAKSAEMYQIPLRTSTVGREKKY